MAWARRRKGWITGACTALGVLVALGTGSSAAETYRQNGVELPRAVEREGLEQPLVLNGAATLRRFFVRIYTVALYVPEPGVDAEAIIEADDRPRRVHLHFAYRSVDGERILRAWEDGAAENLHGELRDAMSRAIEQSRDAFRTDVEKGDEIVYDYTPGEGTRIMHNGEQVAFIEDPLYFRALLAFWIGDDPVDDGARSKLLRGGV